MFWILKRSRMTGAAFLNALNNNNNNNNNNGSTTQANSSAKSQGNSRRGYGRLPPEDPDDVANLNTAGSAGSSSASTPTAPNAPPHLGPQFCDLDLGDDFSDDSDYDESLTCNVCDRAFSTTRLLQQHQQKKRHFGCSACDSLFPSLMALEHHKEEFEHWSSADDVISGGSDTDEDFTDIEPSEAEERERLL